MTPRLTEPDLVDPGPSSTGRPCLVWRWPTEMASISSATLGGGLGRARWVIDVEVDHDYTRTDPAAHLSDIATELDLEGVGVGLMTAAAVGSWTRGVDDGVVVDGTIGVTRPTWAADADGTHGEWRPDTINLLAQLPVRLSDAAMVNAIVTVTEAKSQALLEAGVPGTGTASDAICVVCPLDGSTESFAGPRSVWGARLARATHRCVAAGLQAGRGTP